MIYPATAVFAFACLAVLPGVRAVSPPPDGGYAGGNTAEGQSALLSLTSGTYNTAIGFDSLVSLDASSLCTGVGAGTLLLNTASENTATGAGALLSNTSGASNTAIGAFALFSNTDGPQNTALGTFALEENTTGLANVATGAYALESNISGNSNTANGFNALGLSIASDNTAVGESALSNDTTGGSNTAIGEGAGLNQTTGSNNVYIGAGINGVAGESNACRIASIFGATITNGTEVFINSDNRLGTITSSKRFKQNITPTRSASDSLYELQPVTFQYKKEVDPKGKRQFGLVAEDVEKVNPDLVVHDKEGRPYSVRYDQVNAMLLNEFLKEHRTVLELKSQAFEQEATIATERRDFEAVSAEQGKQIQALTATVKKQASQIQKVSAQLDVQ
jgi:hypothetical protein